MELAHARKVCREEERQETSPLPEGRTPSSGTERRAESRGLQDHRSESRQTEWPSECASKGVELNSDTALNTRLDHELLNPLLIPIMSDISELRNDVKTMSNLQNVHNRALHQTQVVVMESANLLKQIQSQLLPSLEKNLGNILIDSHKQQNTQNMSALEP